MKPIHIALSAALGVVANAHAQLFEPASVPTLQATTPRAMLELSPARRVYAGSDGLPPADPKAPDYYRADPKLYAGIIFNPYLGIEAKFTNPGYREGLYFVGLGPRQAKPVPLGVGGFDFETVGRLTVPVDDKLSAFGTLGVAAIARQRHYCKTLDIGPAGSVGATYKLNNGQTATAEIPLGAAARKAMSGQSGGIGARLKLGF